MKKIIIRELRRMRSDFIYPVAIVLIPCFCAFFFITMFLEGLPTNLPVGVIDNDNSALSRNFIRQADAMQMIDINRRLSDFSEAEKEMKKGNIYAFIIIPRDMQAEVLTGKQPELAFYYNNAFFIPGSLLYRDLSTISAMFAASVTLNTALAKGKTAEEVAVKLQPVVLDTHLIGNPYTNYSVYLSNVLIPGMFMLMVLLITVYAIGIELKYKTSREWLLMADGSVVKALIGKLLPYTVIYIILMFCGNLLLYDILQFPMKGSRLALMSASVLLVIATQALGVFMIGALPVLRKALSISAVLGMLAVSFTGFSFPVEQMLPFIQPLPNLLPLRHFFVIYQNIALNDISWIHLRPRFAALSAFALLPFIILIRLKKAMIHNNYV